MVHQHTKEMLPDWTLNLDHPFQSKDFNQNLIGNRRRRTTEKKHFLKQLSGSNKNVRKLHLF